jgi:hypothetical protein
MINRELTQTDRLSRHDRTWRPSRFALLCKLPMDAKALQDWV